MASPTPPTRPPQRPDDATKRSPWRKLFGAESSDAAAGPIKPGLPPLRLPYLS